MRTTSFLFPLAAIGLVAATPLVEERAALPAACNKNHPKINSAVTNAAPSIATPYCQGFMKKSTKTMTKTASKVHTVTVRKTETGTKTVTKTKKLTSTVKVTASASDGSAAVTTTSAAKSQTLTTDTIPKRPDASGAADTPVSSTETDTSATSSTATSSATQGVTVGEPNGNSTSMDRRDMHKRAAMKPKAFSTLDQAQISTACSCINPPHPTTTITETKSATKTETTTVFSTKEATKTDKAVVTQTVASTPVSFYLQATGNNVTIEGLFGHVSDETMVLVQKTQASKFTLSSDKELISGSNGWIANTRNGSTPSSLFFSSEALIDNSSKKINLVRATCVNTGGELGCRSQNLDTFYYCDFMGSQLVLASKSYDGAGCKKITFKVSNN